MLAMALRTSVCIWALGPKKKAATTAGFILSPILKRKGEASNKNLHQTK